MEGIGSTEYLPVDAFLRGIVMSQAEVVSGNSFLNCLTTGNPRIGLCPDDET
jgi:hypothetical protein